MGIGSKIRALRTAKGLTLQGLSVRAGRMSKGYLYRLEQDESENPPNPSLEIIKRIAEALEVNVSDLMEGEDIPDISKEWQETLKDRNLQVHFRELKKLSEKDREIALRHVKMLRKMEEEKKKK